MFILEYKIDNIKDNEYYIVSLLRVTNKVPMEKVRFELCSFVLSLP